MGRLAMPRIPKNRTRRSRTASSGRLASGAPADIDEVDYKAALPSLQDYCDRMRTAVGMLLRAEDIRLGAPLESRVKSWPSLCDKLARSDRPVECLEDVKDLVGIRVILLYRPDIDRALDVLRGEFFIEAEEKKGMDEDAEAFGYQSVHVVLRDPAPNGGEGPTAAASEASPPLRAEVQIRSLAQHIWAAASHDLQYKKERAVPKPLRRTIQRVSALLETIDLELERVLAEREDYLAEVETDAGQLLLDIDILRKLLDQRLPSANRDPDERYAKIMEALKGAGIETVGALSDLIDGRLEEVLAFDRQIVSALAASGVGQAARLVDFNEERLSRGVYFSFEGLVRKMLEYEKAAYRRSRSKTR